jgi:Leucine-rich repeat (LRR) protein
LNLSSNYLDGILPNNIYDLQTIEVIDFKQNKLKGSLTYKIEQLLELTVLILTNNSFSGLIPNEFRNLQVLTQLYLDYNEFSGTIPEWIGDLSYLTELSLVSNQLTGSVPSKINSNLSSSSSLTYLSFGSNELTGTIPSWIGDLHLLSYLDLSTNHLNGSIPASMSNLKSVISLILRNNYLTGSFPTWICSFTNTTLLLLDNNELSGTLPTCILYLSSLTSFDLGQNKLHGTIPNSIGELSQLQILQLDNNHFTGILPSSLSRLVSLVQLYLSSNFLTGSMDKNIFDSLTQLQIIEIQHNLFTGSIPLSLARLPFLNRLFVQDNLLSGHLDMVFNGSLQRNLSNVQLSNNQFTGTLPEQLFLTNSLVSVSAVSNCFHGLIPLNICMNNRLQTLALDGLGCASSCRNIILPGMSSAYISNRQITGGIPSCLFSMPYLELLHISGNRISGTIPSNTIVSIKDLILSYNFLTGTIPNTFQSNQWTNLDLSNNRLSGTLHSGFNATYHNSSLTSNNNRLSGFIPLSIYDLNNIDILEGNIFDCKFDRSDVPSHDKDKDFYECGSNTLNLLGIVWAGFIIIFIFGFILLWFYDEEEEGTSSLFMKNLYRWLFIVSYFKIPDESESAQLVINSKLQNMTRLQRYLKMFELIRKLSLYSTAFIIIVLLPVYGGVTAYYNTHTYEYAWTIAAMYLSGNQPFGVIFSVLVVFSILIIYFIETKLKQQSCNYCLEDVVMNDFFNGQQNFNINDNRYIFWRLCVAYVVINLIVVSGVNVCYIIAILYGNNTALIIISKILLSVFKLFWNFYIAPLMIRWMAKYLSIQSVETYSTLFYLQFVVNVFNNIIIPCLLIIVISPNCFFEVFQPESDVTSTFHYTDCAVVNLYDVCIEYKSFTSTTSYSPPFIYSYQCSVNFITFYSPVFIFVCIISTFIMPLIQVLWIKWKLPNILQFGNLIHTDNTSKFKMLIFIDEIHELIAYQLLLVTLTMTFGTIYPPLAVAFFITICANTYYNKIYLGRFLSYVVNNNSYENLDILEDNMKVQPLLSTIRKCCWFSLFVSCSFYTLFLFDILGDSMGFYKAYWILIVMPCVPLYLYITQWIFCKYFTKATMEDQKLQQQQQTQQTQQTQSQSRTNLQGLVELSQQSNPMTTLELNQRCSILDKDIDPRLSSLQQDIAALDRHGDSITF